MSKSTSFILDGEFLQTENTPYVEAMGLKNATLLHHNNADCDKY